MGLQNLIFKVLGLYFVFFCLKFYNKYYKLN